MKKTLFVLTMIILTAALAAVFAPEVQAATLGTNNIVPEGSSPSIDEVEAVGTIAGAQPAVQVAVGLALALFGALTALPLFCQKDGGL